MNNTAIDIAGRIAATHRADIARDVAATRTARRTRQPAEPVVTEVPSPRRGGWTRWIPTPRPAH
jgi:hypothetical protein